MFFYQMSLPLPASTQNSTKMKNYSSLIHTVHTKSMGYEIFFLHILKIFLVLLPFCRIRIKIRPGSGRIFSHPGSRSVSKWYRYRSATLHYKYGLDSGQVPLLGWYQTELSLKKDNSEVFFYKYELSKFLQTYHEK